MSGCVSCLMEFCSIPTTYTANQWSDELPTIFHIAGGVVPNHVVQFVIVKIHT